MLLLFFFDKYVFVSLVFCFISPSIVFSGDAQKIYQGTSAFRLCDTPLED